MDFSVRKVQLAKNRRLALGRRFSGVWRLDTPLEREEGRVAASAPSEVGAKKTEDFFLYTYICYNLEATGNLGRNHVLLAQTSETHRRTGAGLSGAGQESCAGEWKATR